MDWLKEPSSAKAEFSTESLTTRVASGKRVVIEDKRYRVYRPHNTALSVLIIRRSKKQDAGIYRCNLSGSTTRHKYMILNVTGQATMTIGGSSCPRVASNSLLSYIMHGADSACLIATANLCLYVCMHVYMYATMHVYILSKCMYVCK